MEVDTNEGQKFFQGEYIQAKFQKNYLSGLKYTVTD